MIRQGWRILALVVGMFAGYGVAAAENAAATATPRDDNWKKRHEGFVAIAKKGDIDVLFIGDSITDSWRNAGMRDKHAIGGKNVWEKEFKDWKAANFGIGGDKTQHVLWRLQNGELDGIKPKVVVLMIGTNNSNGNDHTPEEIAEGIAAIVKEIHNKSADTKVLLLGIFPRQKLATHPQRAKLRKVNEIIAKLDDGGKKVKYLDIGNKFVDESTGDISDDIMYDYLHLTEKGYQIWAEAIKKPVEDLMKGK